jgi:steroid 5-alpha reductase family enzyme
MIGAQVALLSIAVAAALSIVMTGAWLVWRRTGNSGWVDAVWTFGLGAIGAGGAMAPALPSGNFTERQVLVSALMAIWALRLGSHIARRNLKITDDPRYAKLLRDWGDRAPMQMFWLLQKQALVSVPLAVSVILAAWNPLPGLRPLDFLAATVLISAIAGEGMADRQLRRFRADPANRGQVCNAGLWAWSRHPNYFSEWFGWLAYPLFAIDLSGGWPWGFIALAGPVCMYWLLVHISGIPPLEAHMLERRRDAFRAYQARTNAFFPAPPRLVDGSKP